jgi:hypothetical protein
MNRTRHIEHEIKPLRDKLKSHDLYKKLGSISDVQLFMEAHVFAVWDFMSLLKSLQRDLTCVDLPWRPAPDPSLARFINEIVWAEESDVDENGTPASHFEMYLAAMREVGASTAKINDFLSSIKNGSSVTIALQNLDLDSSIKNFVDFTFEVIDSGKPHQVAAAFTFGREDVIPDMFIEILKKADPEEKKFVKMRYYLDRHIELDGDEHGPLALKMVSQLCGNDDQKWNEVLQIAQASLQKRIELWDGIANRLSKKQHAISAI